MTAPTGGQTWANGASQTVSWTIAPPASSGSFRVILYDPNTMAYYEFDSAVPAVTGQTSYTDTKLLSGVAVGVYKVRVWYRDGTGAYIVSGDQAGTITVTLGDNPGSITVTAPTAGQTWINGLLQTVSWTVGTPVTSGSFRVILYDPNTMAYYEFDSMLPAVAAQTAYTDTRMLSGVAPGAYKVRVWYRDAAGTYIVSGDQSGTVTVP